MTPISTPDIEIPDIIIFESYGSYERWSCLTYFESQLPNSAQVVLSGLARSHAFGATRENGWSVFTFGVSGSMDEATGEVSTLLRPVLTGLIATPPIEDIRLISHEDLDHDPIRGFSIVKTVLASV